MNFSYKWKIPEESKPFPSNTYFISAFNSEDQINKIVFCFLFFAFHVVVYFTDFFLSVLNIFCPLVSGGITKFFCRGFVEDINNSDDGSEFIGLHLHVAIVIAARVKKTARTSVSFFLPFSLVYFYIKRYVLRVSQRRRWKWREALRETWLLAVLWRRIETPSRKAGHISSGKPNSRHPFLRFFSLHVASSSLSSSRETKANGTRAARDEERVNILPVSRPMLLRVLK